MPSAQEVHAYEHHDDCGHEHYDCGRHCLQETAEKIRPKGEPIFSVQLVLIHRITVAEQQAACRGGGHGRM